MIDSKSPENQLDLFCDRMYTKEEMLKAWIAGRNNAIVYGFGDGDKPDFATWIKLLG